MGHENRNGRANHWIRGTCCGRHLLFSAG
jgi:hypothetical protein